MNISHNIFHHDNLFTIGVEEEYMLCHPRTGELINKADEIMSAVSDKDRYSYELLLSEIETNTPICETVDESINLLESTLQSSKFNSFDKQSTNLFI